jgi:hypothetical protein
LIASCGRRKRRANIFLILVTEGGDPDAAYRIARCLQDGYEKFSVCVSGYCKSAGALVALGANEIVYSRNGELGPLDVQMAKKDELWETESGLTTSTALTALRTEAFATFEEFFLSISASTRGRITLHTASEIAAKLTEGLFAPITGQLDPLRMGEALRSMTIGKEYGIRLMAKGRNFNVDSLEQMLSKYPSHGFVIDGSEARTLFLNVRDCTSEESALLQSLGDVAEVPDFEPIVQYLVEEPGDQNATTIETNNRLSGVSEPIETRADA